MTSLGVKREPMIFQPKGIRCQMGWTYIDKRVCSKHTECLVLGIFHPTLGACVSFYASVGMSAFGHFIFSVPYYNVAPTISCYGHRILWPF